MLGDEIRKARIAAGLTQEQLAFRARISRNYVSLLELGVKSPTVETLERVSVAMGIRQSVLIARWEGRRRKGKGSLGKRGGGRRGRVGIRAGER